MQINHWFLTLIWTKPDSPGHRYGALPRHQLALFNAL